MGAFLNSRDIEFPVSSKLNSPKPNTIVSHIYMDIVQYSAFVMQPVLLSIFTIDTT